MTVTIGSYSTWVGTAWVGYRVTWITLTRLFPLMSGVPFLSAHFIALITLLHTKCLLVPCQGTGSVAHLYFYFVNTLAGSQQVTEAYLNGFVTAVSRKGLAPLWLKTPTLKPNLKAPCKDLLGPLSRRLLWGLWAG